MNKPDIWQLWYTTALFRPVKSTPKSALIHDEIAKTGHNMPKFLFDKKYTRACCDWYEQ